jgi:ribosomal protein S18 acetylase RimI-like enzyme
MILVLELPRYACQPWEIFSDREHDGGGAVTTKQRMGMNTLSFRCATVEDADAISGLVNSAYRGESSKQGWTTEADLLEGLRTTAQEIQQLITGEDSFLLLCFRGAMLAGSVHVEKQGAQAYIGMFVVRPDIQGAGIGKHLLKEAETLARKAWQVNSYVMVVITSRHELIAFYERRGYQRTGELNEFPVNPALWTPKVDGLKMERMEKRT